MSRPNWISRRSAALNLARAVPGSNQGDQPVTTIYEHEHPSVGRIVHYLSRGSADGVFPPKCRAAIVTDVRTIFCVSLAVLNPTGLFFDTDLTHSGRGERPFPGSWHWHIECPDTAITCANCGRVLMPGDALCCRTEPSR